MEDAKNLFLKITSELNQYSTKTNLSQADESNISFYKEALDNYPFGSTEEAVYNTWYKLFNY